MKNLYRYEGMVKEFDKVVSTRWVGETLAESPQKAKSNLSYRYKKETGRMANCKISLPDKIEKIE